MRTPTRTRIPRRGAFAVVQIGAPILRKTASTVPDKDMAAPSTRRIVRKMADILRATEHGIAIAAPQVGIPLRIFIVLESVYRPGADDPAANKTEARMKKRRAAYMTFINPRIIRHAKKHAEMEEGCLSVDGKYGKVPRYEKVTVAAHDENGNAFTRGAAGLFAQVIQHETDHLNGVLFVDRATALFTPEHAHSA